MKAPWAALLLLFLALPTVAQTPPAPEPSALEISAGERQFFALGLSLAQGAFAYAELSQQAAAAGKTRRLAVQLVNFATLEPTARRDRAAAGESFAQAVRLMQTLDAPPAALLPIARAAARLGKPLPMTANARTLAALSEFTTLSALPENPALRQWLASPSVPDSAQVWYDEGEICGLAQIAAAHQMPEFLPPAEQLATDLRGLRDWLALRLPDTPTSEQISLKSALEAFLQQAALTTRPGIKSRKALTPAQLQALGSISEQVQAQALGLAIVPRFAKFEASFTLPNQSGNPFDPADNDVQVTFAGPNGQSVTIPAFWDGDRWRARFAPTQTGDYELTVKRGGAAISPADLSPLRFRCTASQSPGFARRDGGSAQRFVFDNGQSYYPLGMNVAWTSRETGDYPVIFQQMGAAHMNWARVWMTFWDGKALEWSPDKSKNPPRGELLLAAARRWDAIFDAADQNGIYVQMTLQHHGQYTETTDPNWKDNPFNAANGGFLAHPDDFFTDPQAKRLTKAKYRYIVARWGYSTHLLSYELFNEVQNIGEAQSHFSDVLAWHKEMAAALRSVDTNHHLLTTSYTMPGEPLAGIGLDYDQPHEYTGDLLSYFAGLRGADKPLFTGEWGPNDTKNNMTEGMLHDGQWASLMAPTAGAGQFWYWDQVIAQKWWPQFASASDFLHTETSPTDRMPLERVRVGLKTSGAFGDLSFAPPDGWGKTTRSMVIISPNGEAPDLHGISAFIQGSNHPDMRPNPIVFVLNCPSPCQFQMNMGTVARSGAHPTLTVDGTARAEADFPASGADHQAGRTLSVDLTGGPHRVALSNTGLDWVTVSRLTITHYAPPIAVLARGNAHRVVFWAYNRDRTNGVPAEASLLFSGLAPGSYTARLWDTWQGRALPPVPVIHQGSLWEVRLPADALRRDVAGVVEAADKTGR